MTPATLEAVRILTDNSSPRHADGWCWMDKAVAMCELIERVKPTCVVELGIFGGRSMLPQALMLKELGHGVIYGIDPWTRPAALEGEHAKADADWWGKQDLERIMIRFMGQVVNLGLVDVAIPIRATSQAVKAVFSFGSIDILHIDGNHSELASLRDIDLYFPKVRPGGHIWLDDIGWPTNAAAVMRLDGLCETIMDVKSKEGHCRLYRKADSRHS
jgi:predicted O-methyltransferase YrrM